jgi:hypothetical protein
MTDGWQVELIARLRSIDTRIIGHDAPASGMRQRAGVKRELNGRHQCGNGQAASELVSATCPPTGCSPSSP